MMKNAFYFILKALLVFKIFKFFVTTFRSCRKNDFIRKKKLTSKVMMSQSKGNQLMKFGQVIKYNKRNILLQKLCRK